MDNKPLTAEGTATTNCQSGLHSLAGGEKPFPAEAEQSGETFDGKSRATAPSPCRRWEARRVGKENLGCEVDGNRAGHGDDICWLVKRSRFTLMAPFTNFTKYIYIYIWNVREGFCFNSHKNYWAWRGLLMPGREGTSFSTVWCLSWLLCLMCIVYLFIGFVFALRGLLFGYDISATSGSTISWYTALIKLVLAKFALETTYHMPDWLETICFRCIERTMYT